MGLIISGFLFGAIGLAYFVYGKKAEEYRFLGAGLLLMIYPYFIQTLWLSILVGLLLVTGPILMNRFL